MVMLTNDDDDARVLWFVIVFWFLVLLSDDDDEFWIRGLTYFWISFFGLMKGLWFESEMGFFYSGIHSGCVGDEQ
ncbi:hypothetical protein TSUD_381240 [Trifolium subterraneum]|uniref:Transmembrane protein n=1 Tax=Trifolium subterraneum TaxID=3900 RepID=A0A2Z6NGP0_TRISU|nr:hypothetical protein TSUD_381240 [Trifolium subterraneum]